MSEQEREQSTDEEREETFRDLDVPEDQRADVTGGKKKFVVEQRPDKD